METVISAIIYIVIFYFVFRAVMRKHAGENGQKPAGVNPPAQSRQVVQTSGSTGRVAGQTAGSISKAASLTSPDPDRPVVHTYHPPQTYYSQKTKKKNNGVNAHMAREKINIGGWEDRKNDWLARQMAEEKASARRMSEMFQIKLEHRYNCEAEMLRQFHESHCTAEAVDTGDS